MSTRVGLRLRRVLFTAARWGMSYIMFRVGFVAAIIVGSNAILV